MKFQYDLFFSFHLSDNEAINETGKGWVSSFHRFLESILFQMLGEKPRVLSNYDNENLNGGSLEKTALHLIILSPEYLNSKESLEEAELCIKTIEESDTPRIGGKKRVFKIVKSPIEREEQPDFLKIMLGYDLFNLDYETGHAEEFREFFGPEAEKMYWMKLADLAYDIYQTIKDLNVEREYNNNFIPDGKPGAIYLADTGLDLIIQRDIIRRELLRHGFRVLPEATLPLDIHEFENAVKNDLKECRLSIHLMGDSYGEVLKGSDESVPEIQNRLAAQHDKDNTESGANPDDFIRLVWIPSNSNPESEKQKSVLENLRRESDAESEAEILQTPLEDLKTIIMNILVHNDMSYIRSKKYMDKEENGQQRVYLIHEPQDHQELEPVISYLHKQGFQIIPTDFEGNNIQLRHKHQDKLTFCDAVLVVYNSGNLQWLISKLLDVLKAPGFGRKTPLLASAVLMMSQEETDHSRINQFNIPFIHYGSNEETRELQQFVQQINPQLV